MRLNISEAIMNELSNSLKEENLEVETPVEEVVTEEPTELNEQVLVEAPIEEEPIEEPVDELPIEEPVEEVSDEEMTDAEVEEEVEDDEEDKIEDAIEQPFYATTEEYDELRDILVELDYRLFLINDNLVVVGRLNGPDIEILTSSNNGEEVNYSFVKAPGTLNELKSIENVFYLSPDMTEEEQAEFEGKVANHEGVVEYLMNQLPEDKKEELSEPEVEEVPELEEPVEGEETEIIEEPIEEPVEEEDEEDEIN